MTVGTPRSRATRPAFTDGSIPKQGIPAAAKWRRRYPSLLATSTTNDSTERRIRLTVSPTNVFACSDHASENEEKWRCSASSPPDHTKPDICSNRQFSHTRRCSGNVGSAQSSSPGLRKLPRRGVAPRSKTLCIRTESHKRQCNWDNVFGSASASSCIMAHRGEEARTAAGAHRGPGVWGRPDPIRTSRDPLLPGREAVAGRSMGPVVRLVIM